MSTAAVLGFGTLLKRGDTGSPEVFTTVAEVKKISKFGAERELVEATSHDSPNAYREFILGLKDGSEFTAMCNLILGATQDSSTGIINEFNNGTRRNYQLVIPTSPTKTASFPALARAYMVDPQLDKTADIEFTFKITGPITWA